MDLEFEEIRKNKPYLNFYKQENSTNIYELLEAKNKREYFLKFNHTNLASSISPKKQAKRQIDTYKKIEEIDIIVLLGMGNPHLFEMLNSLLPAGKIILAFDFSICSFHILWDLFLKDILKVKGRHIFCGRFSLPFLNQYLGSIKVDNFSKITFIHNRANLQMHYEFYNEIEKFIQKDISSKISDALTRFELEKSWLKNTIQNLYSIDSNFNISYIKFWKNKLKNIPTIIVSAGPSLKEHCHWIKEHRDKLFVLCCDTALKVLSKFNIVPDGIVTLDSQVHSIFHFLGENLKDVILFSDFVGHPFINQKINFKSIIYSMTTKYIPQADGSFKKDITSGGALIGRLLGEIGEIQSGGSVATTALDMVRHFTSEPIFLIGQDLAYTGREIHSTGTHHNGKWLTLVSRKNSLEKINEQIIQKRQTKIIPSIDGKSVLSDYILLVYKSWFEEAAKSFKSPIYNIGKKGAYIENMQNISTIKASEIISSYKSHNYFWKAKIKNESKIKVKPYIKRNYFRN